MSERACRMCGCTEDDACVGHGLDGFGACFWVDVDLCSACAPARIEELAIVMQQPGVDVMAALQEHVRISAALGFGGVIP